MTADPPLDDLLVVGGLTIDRFEDGLAPGGSVLHATRAAARAGLRTAVVTTAGTEPTAGEGIAELTRLATSAEIQPATETIRFRHRETAAGRRLWLECAGGQIDLADEAVDRRRIRAVLFAPVVAEVEAPMLGFWSSLGRRGAILQGWLRRSGEGGQVEQIAPDTLDDELVAAVGRLDVLIASREDLVAAAEAPAAQLRALRARVGAGPILIVTDGPEGVWIGDGPAAPRHLPAPWRVEGVPMVGAGDAFGALFVAGLDPTARAPADLDGTAERAMRGVAEMLEARR